MFDNIEMWVESLHIISVIAWMVSLLYLPRLFVYHSGVPVGSDTDKIFITMERKLFFIIMVPGMISTLFFGTYLIILTGHGAPGTGYWLHIKLLLVLLLLFYQWMIHVYRVSFLEGERVKSAKFFRFFNEIPTVLMILMVFLVVLKPV